MSLQQFDERRAVLVGQVWTNSNGGNAQGIFAGITDQYRVDEVHFTSTCVATRQMTIRLTYNTDSYIMGEVEIPAGAGHGAVPPVVLAAPLWPAASGGICMPSPWQLDGLLDSAPGSGEQIDSVAFGGEV